MKRYVGHDANGVPRVWGEGPTFEIAESRCKDEALTYLRRRPDTGPLAKWTFKQGEAR